MKELLKSGATLDITISNIKNGYALFQAVVGEFKKNGVKLTFEKDDDLLDFGKIFSRDMSAFIDNLLNVVTSDSVVNLIFACAGSCIYEKNGVKQKITWELFEQEENRGDFFEVMFLIAKRNLAPFFPKARIK